MKHIKFFFVGLYYGFHSRESFKYHCIHFQKMNSIEFGEFTMTREYESLSKVMRWPQIERARQVRDMILCFAILIAIIIIFQT